MTSSKTDQHATPRKLAAELVQEFGIETDVCADASNAVVPKFFSLEQNGLLQEWKGVNFMNPPYGKGEKVCGPKCEKKKCAKRGSHCLVYVPSINDWMRKATESADAGAIVVCLVPSRTDARWWHDWIEPVRLGRKPGHLRFIRGRLKFGNAKSTALFPNAIVVLGRFG